MGTDFNAEFHTGIENEMSILLKNFSPFNIGIFRVNTCFEYAKERLNDMVSMCIQ